MPVLIEAKLAPDASCCCTLRTPFWSKDVHNSVGERRDVVRCLSGVGHCVGDVAQPISRAKLRLRPLQCAPRRVPDDVVVNCVYIANSLRCDDEIIANSLNIFVGSQLVLRN